MLSCHTCNQQAASIAKLRALWEMLLRSSQLLNFLRHGHFQPSTPFGGLQMHAGRGIPQQHMP